MKLKRKSRRKKREVTPAVPGVASGRASKNNIRDFVDLFLPAFFFCGITS